MRQASRELSTKTAARGAARERLEPERARAGVQVEHGRAVDRADQVERRLADEVRRRPRRRSPSAPSIRRPLSSPAMIRTAVSLTAGCGSSVTPAARTWHRTWPTAIGSSRDFSVGSRGRHTSVSVTVPDVARRDMARRHAVRRGWRGRRRRGGRRRRRARGRPRRRASRRARGPARGGRGRRGGA